MIDEIGGAGVFEIYSSAGTGKTGGVFNADPSGLLATIPLESTPFGTVAAGSASLNGPLEAEATGGSDTAPLSYRIKSASGGGVSTVVIEGECDVQPGSPTNGKLSLKTNVTAGGDVRVSSYTITAGNA